MGPMNDNTQGMGHRRSVSGDEFDALPKARQVYFWQRGELRRIKRRVSKRQRRQGRASARHQDASEPPIPMAPIGREHVYDGERCTYCGVNMYDIGIYPDAPEGCLADREPVVYTTETPGS